MKATSLIKKARPGSQGPGGDILSAALTLASLGVAVWALEAAEWVNPQPSLLLALVLGVIGGTLLARTRLGGRWASPFIVLGGLAIAIWQSVALFPAIEGLSSWPRWFEALTRPADNPIAFIFFLVAISWLSGAIGAWYAVRRRNGWPALVFGTLMVTLNLVNLPRDFGFILPLYLVLGLALVAQTRWRRGQGATTSRKPKQSFAALTLCMIIVLGAFILPQAPAERFNLNIDGGSVYSAIKNNALNIFSSVPSKLKTIRSSSQEAVNFASLPDQGEAIRFIVSMPTPGYFRTRYYDTYSATGWTNSPLSDKEIASGQTVADAVALSKAVMIRYEVENAVKTDLILLNGQAASLSIPVVVRSLPAPGSGDIMAVVSPRLLTPYQPYMVTAYLPAVTADDLIKSKSDYPAWVTERYLQLPGKLPPSVVQLSRQLTRGLDSSYVKVLAIKRYLQGLGYDVNGADVTEGADGVVYFLSSRQGNCVNFASALVVMLRSVGVPARFCQGYLGTELDDEGKHLLIRANDSHAWAEVYFPEFGWITVEATPGRPADDFDSSMPIIPGETPVPDGTTDPFSPGSEVVDTGVVDATDAASDNLVSSLSWPGIMMVFFLGAVLLLGGGGTLYLTQASRPDAAYARLGWFGKLFRLPAKPTETPLEYARRLGGRLPVEASDINLIATTFTRMRYGPEKALTRENRTELNRLWGNLSKRLLRRRLGLIKDD